MNSLEVYLGTIGKRGGDVEGGGGRWSHDEDLVLAALIIRIAGRPATRGGRHEFRKLIGARVAWGYTGGKRGVKREARPAAARLCPA